MDIKQSACVYGHRCALCVQRWRSWCVPLISHLITHLHPLTEELLIDFRELIGEHSGENMAEAVWATMELYGLVGKVSFRLSSPMYPLMRSQIIAIVMDNASNNNTMMTSLERRCQQRGIEFSAQDARMRCMPHTIHLAALKVFFISHFRVSYDLYLMFHSLAPGRNRSTVEGRRQEGSYAQQKLPGQHYNACITRI
jgi:hypothetical protein